MNKNTKDAITRQIPFLIGGTVTGLVMTFYYGFLITVIFNSIIWYFISYFTYKLLWRKDGFGDQKLLLFYVLNKLKSKKRTVNNKGRATY